MRSYKSIIMNRNVIHLHLTRLPHHLNLSFPVDLNRAHGALSEVPVKVRAMTFLSLND